MSRLAKLILVSSDLKMGGHAPSYLDAWGHFLRSRNMSYEIRCLKYSAGTGHSLGSRCIKFLKNLLESLSFWIPTLLRREKDHRYLFVDAPCSFPLGIRWITAGILSGWLATRTYIICHAFPGGGDHPPVDSRPWRWKKYFKAAAVFAHSKALREFLVNPVGLSPQVVHASSWGCSPLHPGSPHRQGSALHLLFFGQYRSSKGLEWLWKELQPLDFPCHLYIAISCTPQIGKQVEGCLAAISKPGLIHRYSLKHASYFTDQEIAALFDDVDLMVLPYERAHCLVSGLVYLAASHGCPVVSSTHSESGTIQVENEFGFSFAPEDSDELRDGLKKFWQLPLEKQMAMRKCAEKFALSHSWDRAFDSILQVIENHSG